MANKLLKIKDEIIKGLSNFKIISPDSPLRKQIEREPYDFPTIEIKNKYDNINDYTVDDIIINNYNCHNSVTMKMRA
jgi:hypothetical protein